MGRTEFNKAKLEEQSFKQLLGSKKDITLVTMNTNGRGVLGLTPKFKLEMIRQHFAANKPDVVFIQDSIDTSDILELIKKGFPKSFYILAAVKHGISNIPAQLLPITRPSSKTG